MNHVERWLKPDWPAPANIHAAVTLRSGGVSQGGYCSFNLAQHVGDDPEAVSQNRAILREGLALPSEPAWLTQTHSNFAVEAQCNLHTPEADASFTGNTGIVCAVMTADCLPVLLCSEDGWKIAAIHAGWRGLLDGVIDNTVRQLGSASLMAWLGPAIGPERFEVGEEVRTAYLAKSPDFTAGFKPLDSGKWLADIYQLARINLGKLGIENVSGGTWCTVSDTTRFFSYRRETVTGRMATLIWRD